MEIAERVDHLPLSHAIFWARHLDYGNLEDEFSLGNVKNKAGSLSHVSFLFFFSFYQTNIFLVIDEVKSKKDSFTAELLRLVAMGVDNTSEDPEVKTFISIHTTQDSSAFNMLIRALFH